MSALAEALVAAQRRSLATLEKAYVAGAIEAEPMAEAMEACGITDAVDRAFLIASLDVLKEWGVAAPTMSERVVKQAEFASDKQQQLIRDLCKRKNQPEPDAMGALTKASASEIIDSLDNGSYDPQKWTMPF